MRILTLNTHSLIEPYYDDKLGLFCRGVRELDPDVILMQEANETLDGSLSHTRNVCERLGEYHAQWRAMKVGYGKYREGLAVLTRDKADECDFSLISTPRDDWRVRYILGVRVGEMWYYSAHTGRWDDYDEPFDMQISRIKKAVGGRSAIIGGDFNCPEECAGYEVLKRTGWQDIWQSAKVKQGHHTATSAIDGWNNGRRDMRIDYLFSTVPVTARECRVVFTPEMLGVVSDHYGVYAELE